ncbi:hypothetical protein CAEBREN_26222 [Caenorhabditis brenneri]|uniref:Uncharacterized protein n=1 Tax=Caenorhabditis brenneri TaxID=135651 RepID=G0M725_CAEBE|nr:hypothetical protein CAEBREN_26222 [Caenorhabditis brenneri]
MARRVQLGYNNLQDQFEMFDEESVDFVQPEPEAERRRRIFIEENLEKELLMQQIANSEAAIHEQFVRGQSSPEEAERKLAIIYHGGMSQTGYIVNCWPPRPVTSHLFVEKLANVMHKDRILFMTEKIHEFRARPHYGSGPQDNSIVIIVESDGSINQIQKAGYFRRLPLIVIKESDLVNSRKDALNRQITQFENNRFNSILVCHQNLVAHSTVPFAKLNIFHQVTDNHIFFDFVRRLTVNSRLRKEPSDIFVPLNNFDKPAVVEYTAALLAARGEEISTDLLDFVEFKCWANKSQERQIFEEWARDVKQSNLSEESRVREILGIRVEFWWNNHETLRRCHQFVRPLKEIDQSPEDRPWQYSHRSEAENEVTRV